MSILLSSKAGSYAQFIAVLVVFILVLAITLFTTKWMADYQKKGAQSGNIEIIDYSRIGANKFIYIVRVGNTFKVIATGKDTVTDLGEIAKDDLVFRDHTTTMPSFKEILDKFKMSDENKKN